MPHVVAELQTLSNVGKFGVYCILNSLSSPGIV